MRPGKYAKAWWNSTLKELRLEMTAKQRRIRPDDVESRLEYLRARNTYFQEVKKAKSNHWNTFLEKENSIRSSKR
jgi:hypothetical protein